MADVSPSVAACMSDMASEILTLRARLAEVEAERDQERKSRFVAYRLAGEAQARLAEVEALCDWAPDDTSWSAGYNVAIRNARAAARGDSDRG